MAHDPTGPAAGMGAGPEEEPRQDTGAADPTAPQPSEPAAEPVSASAGEPASTGAEPASTDAEQEPATPQEPTGSRAARSLETGRRVGRRLVRSKLAWAAAAVFVILAFAWQRCGISGCPSVARLASYQPGGASVLLDRNGEPFADLRPVEHAIVEIESLPDYVPAAFVAVEDKRFYQHNGVDWRRVAGALVANLEAWRLAEGSSTITMQLSRNLFPQRIRAAERTLKRKLLEVRVARDIERRFTKDEILELYLNYIYFGAGAYGIEAAARTYFGRPAKQLTLEQAALLAALPKAPTNYDPRRYEERSRRRRDLVLALMAEQGFIQADEAERARSRPIRLTSARIRRAPAPRAAYFVQAVREQLEEELGEALYARPLRIRTTIDLRAQRAAEEELERQLRRVEAGDYGDFDGPRLSQHKAGQAQTEYLQGAVVILENGTGDVLAMVGGRDARHSSFNRAIAARRQAGSAFKPFVYAAALARGYAPARMLDDSPYRLVRDGRAWEPSNFDGEFLGEISFRDALVQSRNVPTIRLAHEIGENNVIRLARAAGIRAELRETPMIALGIAEVSPLELTSAYTVFSGQGEAVAPRMVLSITDSEGRTIRESHVERRRVLRAEHAYMMTDLLRDVVDRGTGRAVRYAGYRGLAAGKTGTTNDGADVWFVGYTSRVTAGVWVGFDKPRPIAEQATGGSVAALTWGRIMTRIASWANGRPWQPPAGIVEVAIDPETGLRLAEGCVPREGAAEKELFVRGNAPREICPATIDRPGGSSWTKRFFAWAGDVVRNIFVRPNDEKLAAREDERLAAREDDERESRRNDEDDARAPGWTQPFRADRLPEPEWTSPLPRVEWRTPEEVEWAGDVAQSLRAALAERRNEERARQWLEDLSRAVEEKLDGKAEEHVREFIDDVIRAVEDAAREAREERRRQRREWRQAWREELRDRR